MNKKRKLKVKNGAKIEFKDGRVNLMGTAMVPEHLDIVDRKQ